MSMFNTDIKQHCKCKCLSVLEAKKVESWWECEWETFVEHEKESEKEIKREREMLQRFAGIMSDYRLSFAHEHSMSLAVASAPPTPCQLVAIHLSSLLWPLPMPGDHLIPTRLIQCEIKQDKITELQCLTHCIFHSYIFNFLSSGSFIFILLEQYITDTLLYLMDG